MSAQQTNAPAKGMDSLLKQEDFQCLVCKMLTEEEEKDAAHKYKNVTEKLASHGFTPRKADLKTLWRSVCSTRQGPTACDGKDESEELLKWAEQAAELKEPVSPVVEPAVVVVSPPPCAATQASDMESGRLGKSLSWQGITYKVRTNDGFIATRILGREATEKTILRDVIGVVQAGHCVALMGPSGCGKTTLLDSLARRVTGIEGDVIINGEVVHDVKGAVAYVTQDDSLCGSLTVRENLYYSAMLRLPSDMKRTEKLERVEEVIQELGLTSCANTKVGTALIRGVSGGERRRVSIGMELVTRPSVLLLDEPTSGLDAKSARMITELLVHLARNGPRAVIATIHQPSSQVFGLFDEVCLMGRGRQVFFGTVAQATEFFARHGVSVPAHNNPADVFLEAINADFGDGATVVKELGDDWTVSKERAVLRNYIETHKSVGSGKARGDRAKYETGMITQLWYLCQRTFWTSLRDFGVFWARILMYAAMALIMATLYLGMGHNQDNIQDRASVLFFSVAFLCFMAVAALPAFVQERAVFIHERRNSYYSVFPYALARVLISLPFIFAIALVFSLLSYFAMNMHNTADSFFYFIVVLSLALLNSEGIVIAISAITPNFIVGIAAGSGLFGVFMLVCGFFVKASNIPKGWIWLHHIVFHKYAFEGFMANEFMGTHYSCEKLADGSCYCMYPASQNDPCLIPGLNILKQFEYESVDKWYWAAVLAAMALFHSFLFYLFLRIFNKGNRK